MTKQLKQQQQIETIALVDIRAEFYVRQAPSEEHILHFMYLYGENAHE